HRDVAVDGMLFPICKVLCSSEIEKQRVVHDEAREAVINHRLVTYNSKVSIRGVSISSGSDKACLVLSTHMTNVLPVSQVVSIAQVAMKEHASCFKDVKFATAPQSLLMVLSHTGANGLPIS
ncbi:hypothetical protein PENTCL1PPCAC_21999, partial [Pristionchus entomophagus]